MSLNENLQLFDICNSLHQPSLTISSHSDFKDESLSKADAKYSDIRQMRLRNWLYPCPSHTETSFVISARDKQFRETRSFQSRDRFTRNARHWQVSTTLDYRGFERYGMTGDA